MRWLVACLLALALAHGALAVHLKFDSLDGWVHSSEEKWSGRAKLDKPVPGLDGQALLVSFWRAALSIAPALPIGAATLAMHSAASIGPRAAARAAPAAAAACPRCPAATLRLADDPALLSLPSFSQIPDKAKHYGELLAVDYLEDGMRAPRRAGGTHACRLLAHTPFTTSPHPRPSPHLGASPAAGISKLLPEAVDPSKDLVLQYDLKLGNGLSCGGACERRAARWPPLPVLPPPPLLLLPAGPLARRCRWPRAVCELVLRCPEPAHSR